MVNPLVLMSQRETDARAALLQFAADLITVALDAEGTVDSRMANRFPWTLALSEVDRETCAQDLVSAAQVLAILNAVQVNAVQVPATRRIRP